MVLLEDIYGNWIFDILQIKFNQWAAQFLPMCQGETLAVDGKAIAGTIKDQNNYQNFVSLIKCFCFTKRHCISL